MANTPRLPEAPANPLDRPGYRLDFNDEFDLPRLDRSKWLPFYLPHWSSRARAAARYTLSVSELTLLVAYDQPPWCPEFDGDVKCSSLQTGLFAGALGSATGQHRFKSVVEVREEQENCALYVPTYGYFEMRAKAELGPDDLAAMWMIGFEDRPERCGEITVCELFGKNVGPTSTGLGYGIKPLHDPALTNGDFHVDSLPFDPAQFHIYAAEWTPDGVAFFFDNERLRNVAQSPAYPMQFMLNVYAFPASAPGAAPRKMPRFTIDYFRAYQPLRGY